MSRIVPAVATIMIVTLAPATVGASPFESSVRPLLRQYCFECHAGDQAESGITLDAYREVDAKTSDRTAWMKVLRQLQGRAMPPADAAQPTLDEMRTVIAWLENEASKPDCSGDERPGRVTVRRLNREEYNNTVRDLFSIAIRPADDFPSDDIGFGFDTIGDVLTIPPVLLERYIDAAETVARAAIASTDVDAAPNRVLPGGVLARAGDLDREFTVEHAGDYVIRVTAWGDQAGPEPPLMSIAIDDREKRRRGVPNERGSPEEHEVRLQLGADSTVFGSPSATTTTTPRPRRTRIATCMSAASRCSARLVSFLPRCRSFTAASFPGRFPPRPTLMSRPTCSRS